MTQAPIDLRVYDDLRQAAGADFVGELVTTFLDEAPGMIAELRRALQAGDPDGFRRAAHSLKSNANVFGAHALAAPARDLELTAGAQATPQVLALLDRVDAEFSRAAAALEGLHHD
ncbi:Hpt domain-containing protein [Sulfitobacter sabulilitoris]|uniref:Hpt domain-containing protein n=1 Tax=Sulfitobacter sabulilitoris TaxID=2562655 RepID=A0A5S3PJ19_9RHOB|nr:Hpt domain-containing protein [Sulfitobacter sabulilitoris]TMM54389.1 Hpt domain-containing protein [Sulfitobacter sabulilitoris]